ncbi:ZCF37 [Striga hermonthica]|uniref:ZCF37 n=1 Tax=Striga hermonthica TaxID=68872 RepID=A0A9N7NVA6_STRHE|nr:ZCF37 [Striga hermonthica]
MFICGSGSFSRQDHDDEEHEAYGSACPTPKRSKRSTSFCKIIGKDNSNKNRFADRGLDKFYALLSDLDNKKQKIYTQKGAEDISFVRFVYTGDSNRAKPIVVKVNKEKKPDRNKSFEKSASGIISQASIKATTPISTPKEEVNNNDQKPRKKRRCFRCKGSFIKMDSLMRPCFYLPVIFVLVLVFLSIYGRSFAIMCTSIGWYVVPSVGGVGPSSGDRKPKRKKEYSVAQNRGPSSPKSVINGLVEIKKINK